MPGVPPEEAWARFAQCLQTAAAPFKGKKFRWVNKGDLPSAFNALCQQTHPQSSLDEDSDHHNRFIAQVQAIANDFATTISTATVEAKIKDWQYGGVRYAISKGPAPTKLDSPDLKTTAPQLPNSRNPANQPSTHLGAGTVNPATSPAVAPEHFSERNTTTARAAAPPPDTVAPPSGPYRTQDQEPGALHYPTAADRDLVCQTLPQSRLRFNLPEAGEEAKWNEISARLLEKCAEAAKDHEGARAMDRIHLAIITELGNIGLQQKPLGPIAPRRQPLPLQNENCKAITKSAKARAKQDPAKAGEVWAAIKIQQQLRDTTSEIHRAQQIRSNHRLATTNPKRLADKIWGRAMGSDPPDCTSTQCEAFFADIFKTTESTSTAPSWLPPQQGPLPLTNLVITKEMVRKALQGKGTKSSPGLDGITYFLLKKLPWAPEMLANQFNKIISQQVCPEVWRYGVTVLLHKGGERSLQNYRPITLTSTISKLFHGIVSGWLERALVSTGTIQTSIQKGFLLGVAGAIEHDMVLDSVLQDAKTHRRTISMLLVDLKNAFGSVPHEKIAWALRRFGAPKWVQSYVTNFYSTVKCQLTSKAWSTNYLQVQRGVLQGDTLSPLLFLLVMQVGLYGLHNTNPNYGYTTSTNETHFLKCFADDLTIVTQKPKQLQLATSHFEEITAWLGLEIKPAKCRSFGLSNGRYRKLNINIYNQTTLNVEDAPSKFLGMQLSLTQTFKEKAQIACKAIQDIIQPLQTFPLPNRDKVQLYRSFALPKMRWVLLVQDLLPTALKRLTAATESNLKDWWHLPRSTSRDALRLLTGIPALSEVADQMQVTKYSIAGSSRDPLVTNVLETRKANGYRPLRRLSKTFGGSIPKSRQEAMAKLKAAQHDQLLEVVSKLLVQGAWFKLGTSLEADKQWRSIMWSLPPNVQQFATKAALDVLPTKANLLRWKVGCDSACQNCGVKETLHHILNHCTHLLNAGAYTWRHNSILQHLLPHIRRQYPNSKVQADLPGQTYLLPFACDTAWRPDIVVHHDELHVDFVELTVPFEPNAAAAHDRKTTKYTPLMAQAKNEGLIPRLHCIEMGSRGIPSQGWNTWVSKLAGHRQITKQCAQIALQTSHVVWLHRHTTWPNPPLLQIIDGDALHQESQTKQSNQHAPKEDQMREPPSQM